MACHPWATCHIAGCCHLANSMFWSHSYMSHCRVLPPGEFNGMSSHSHVSFAGCYHLVNSLPWFQSHMPYCRLQSPGKSMSWSCHIAACNYFIRHIENRFSPYFIFFGFCNAVWVWRAVAFVSSPIHFFRIKTQKRTERLSLTTRLSIPNFSSSRTYTSRPVIITQLMLVISLYLEQWTCTTRTANLFYWKKISVVVLYEAKTIETMWRNWRAALR